MKKSKKVLIAVCIICLVLVRIFTPYLGRPFLIKCNVNGDGDKKFYLSGDVNKIYLFSSHDPCIKFIKYCNDLEELSVLGNPDTFNIEDIANPNLIKLSLSGDGINWSSLNKCTELKELFISCFSNFTTVEDISGLTKLERLTIYNDEELSLSKLNELKNLKELTIVCLNEIDCEDLSQLEKLEKLNLDTHGSIKFKQKTGLKNADQLNKLKNLKELNICCNNDINCEDFAQLENLEVLSLESDGKITGLDSVGMDNLIRINIPITKLTNEAKKKLKEKSVFINYK